MQNPLQSILFHYINFPQQGRDWFVTPQVQPRPRAPLQGPRLGIVAVLQGQSRAWDFQEVKGCDSACWKLSLTEPPEDNYISIWHWCIYPDPAIDKDTFLRLFCIRDKGSDQSAAGLKIWSCLICVDSGILVHRRCKCSRAESRKSSHKLP